jgi:hypothetical protein
MNMTYVNVREKISKDVGRLFVPWLNFEVSMFEGWANEMGRWMRSVVNGYGYRCR